MVSGILHAALAAAVGAVLVRPAREPEPLDISVIDAPNAPTQVVSVSRPDRKTEERKPHAVFGLARKALTASDDRDSAEAKAGNTTAKAPDAEQLRPGDADSLPVPTEEYLVTQMPELAQEIRIPYPPEARRKGIQGPVVMDLLIDSQGKVREAKLIQGPDESLNEAALSAVRGFMFKPARLGDQAVAVRIRYAYRFVLER